MPIEYTEEALQRKGPSITVLAAGNRSLLLEPDWRSGLSPRKVSGEAFLQHVRWAENLPIKKAVLVTAYHSPLEKEMSRIVLRRGGRAIIVPARRPLKRLPPELTNYFEAGQIVFLHPPNWTNPRPTRERCLERNEWIQMMTFGCDT